MQLYIDRYEETQREVGEVLAGGRPTRSTASKTTR